MGDGALKWNYKGPWVSSTCPNTPVSMGFFLVYVEWCVFNRLFGFMCDGCLLARHACCHTLCLLHPHLSSIDLASHYASVMERFKDTCVHFNLNASSSAALSSAASSVAEEPFLSLPPPSIVPVMPWKRFEGWISWPMSKNRCSSSSKTRRVL